MQLFQVIGIFSFKNLILLSISHKPAVYYVNLIFLDLSAEIIFEALYNEASNYKTISTHFVYPFLSFFSSKLLLPQVFLLSSFNYMDQLIQSQETGKISY
jgi:hypothetical protein